MWRGDKSYKEGKCGCGMPWVGDEDSHSHHILPGKSSGAEGHNLFPRAMGTG